jgi:IS30 family transposase
MRQGQRLAEAERTELQRRIGARETFAQAAAAVGCSTKSIQRLLAAGGGPKSRARPRASLRLSLAEREEISRGVGGAASCRAIAVRLGRAPSTVAREIAGKGGRRHYRAWRADAHAPCRATGGPSRAGVRRWDETPVVNRRRRDRGAACRRP